MKTKQLAAAVTGVAIFTTACENLSPGENAGLFGAAAGLATGIPLAVAGVDPAITIPVTAGAVAIAAASAYIISKQQATERQRKIAEQRARIYLARRAKQLAAQPAAAKKQKSPRYIAVQTEKSEQSQGKASVMVFDTQTNEVVGNNVYDLKSAPQVGQTAKFETYSAQYVGTGN
ncbi:MAG: hypothetical protein WC076_11210 [Terrimicrobiaceae bacterium]|jgi:uncharacterized membrane protein YhiD involved in acid resistance|nr:hypothetical protein [Terrimicrobiaceae bacterium]